MNLCVEVVIYVLPTSYILPLTQYVHTFLGVKKCLYLTPNWAFIKF